MADNIIRMTSFLAGIWRGERRAARSCLLAAGIIMTVTAVFSLFAGLGARTAVFAFVILAVLGYLVNLEHKKWTPASVERLTSWLISIGIPVAMLCSFLYVLHYMHQRGYGNGDRLVVIVVLAAAMVTIIFFIGFDNQSESRREDN